MQERQPSNDRWQLFARRYAVFQDHNVLVAYRFRPSLRRASREAVERNARQQIAMAVDRHIAYRQTVLSEEAIIMPFNKRAIPPYACNFINSQKCEGPREAG